MLTCRPGRFPAFTLLELLVVIAILALLIGLVLPAFGQAREKGRIAVCLANAASINAAMNMYQSDDARNLPWFYVHAIEENGDLILYPGASSFTSFSWGGMLPPFSHGSLDCQMTPVELRPFNRYLAPEARRFDEVRLYVCPSDKSAANPGFVYGPGGATPDPDSGTPNWQEYGTSFSISWHWLRAYNGQEPELRDLGKRLMYFGAEMLRATRGAKAANLIWMSENHMDQMLNAAGRADLGESPGTQGRGWHGAFSVHTALFLDGHAEHRYFDTRFAAGLGWTILP